MKRFFVFNIPVKLPKLYILCMILLLNGSYGADYRYDCRARRCNEGPNITFPFYIQGQQEPYCGYPGFILNCSKDGFPVLQLGESEYAIEDILYDSQSFRVVNSAVINLNTSCLPRLHNTSLEKSSFEYADNVTNLHLFSNCTDLVSKNLEETSVCAEREWSVSEERERNVLALYDGDETMAEAQNLCKTSLVMPVEDVGNTPIHVLKRGFSMNWRSSHCETCIETGGLCGFNHASYTFICFCRDMSHSYSCPILPDRKIRLFKIIVGSGLRAILVVIILMRIMRKRVNNNIELFIKQQGDLAPRRYKYSELKKMTKSFSDVLGQGGYGRVYKVKSLDRFMAVKVLNKSKNNGEDFLNEVATIGKTSHVNIVALLGYCIEGSKRALVYEFMPNGSLDKFIAGKTCLSEADWRKLFEIAAGVARGLEYLHRGCQMQILHFDIKPHNILLDKDFSPRISDFGMAKLRPNRASITSISGTRGTVGYIAPELFCRNYGKVSHKSDVYSYGMLVLDIVGEKQNTDPITNDQMSDVYFPHWIYQHLDKGIEDGIGDDEWQWIKRKLTIVGLWCIQIDPNNRPSMGKVIEMLEGKHEALEIPPQPYLSSPSTLPLYTSISESSST